MGTMVKSRKKKGAKGKKMTQVRVVGAVFDNINVYVDIIANELSRRGWTTKQLADAANVSYATALAHVTGNIMLPQVRTVAQIAGALGYELRIRASGKNTVLVDFPRPRKSKPGIK